MKAIFDKPLDVSVIIVDYKTPSLCIDCINSFVSKSDGFSYEIIVIDNFSCDGVEKLLAENFGDKVKYINSGSNLGTAKACNLGCRVARGNYLFYLNTDTVFINNAVKIMLDVFKNNPMVGVVGGNLFNSKKKPIHSYINKYDLNYYKKQSSFLPYIWQKISSRIFSYQFNHSNKNKIVDYVCAAATLIRKDVYEKVGGFDEEIFIYGDEALFAFHCKNLGYSSINCPKSKIIHFEGDSFNASKGFSKNRFDFMIKGNCVYFYRRNGVEGVYKFLDYLKKSVKMKKNLCLFFHKKAKSSMFLAEETELHSIIPVLKAKYF